MQHDLVAPPDDWFTYSYLYDWIARIAPRCGIFVEVGCWKGKSTVYLAKKVIECRKDILILAVDHFKGSSEHQTRPDVTQIWDIFLENITGLEDTIKPMRMDSLTAAGKLSEGSVDFVFIDAEHTEEAVRNDINAWRPKLKPSGIIAGHDIFGPEVRAAVKGSFSHFVEDGNIWIGIA